MHIIICNSFLEAVYLFDVFCPHLFLLAMLLLVCTRPSVVAGWDGNIAIIIPRRWMYSTVVEFCYFSLLGWLIVVFLVSFHSSWSVSCDKALRVREKQQRIDRVFPIFLLQLFATVQLFTRQEIAECFFILPCYLFASFYVPELAIQ